MSKKALLLFSLILNFTYILSATNRTLIGIVANPDPDDTGDKTKSKVNAYYVRWLESAGAQAIIIHPWYSLDQVTEIMSKVNGVLLQGGGRTINLKSGQFEKVVKFVFEEVIRKNKVEKVHFPLWATCQGFELIHLFLMNQWDLKRFDAWNYATPLNHPIERNSSLFSLFNKDEIFEAENNDVTAQFHHYGISEEQYEFYPELKKFFKITSTAFEKSNQDDPEHRQTIYINSVEAREYPIYAVQFHPEKVIYNRKPSDNIPSGPAANRFNQNLANYFVEEAGRNNQTVTDLTRYDYIDTFVRDAEKAADEHYYYYTNNQSS